MTDHSTTADPTTGDSTTGDSTTGDSTTGDDGQWRDERRLPLDELTRAVATSSNEGQTDNRTGNDAGIDAPPRPPAEGDPDPDSAAGRSLRTDFTGPIGPN